MLKSDLERGYVSMQESKPGTACLSPNFEVSGVACNTSPRSAIHPTKVPRKMKLQYTYTPRNQHGTCQEAFPKGNSSSNPSDSRAMLISGRVIYIYIY